MESKSEFSSEELIDPPPRLADDGTMEDDDPDSKKLGKFQKRKARKERQSDVKNICSF